MVGLAHGRCQPPTRAAAFLAPRIIILWSLVRRPPEEGPPRCVPFAFRGSLRPHFGRDCRRLRAETGRLHYHASDSPRVLDALPRFLP